MTTPSTTQTSTLDEPPVQVFVSYAHGDDQILSFVEAFKMTLESLAVADRGRRLEVFLDRHDIGWGEDWQERLHQGVSGALVFVPMITRRYFDRPACRQELLTFYNGARALSVTELLLPVVVLGHRFITVDNPDETVRIIAERQYRSLTDAVLAGPGSAEWTRTMLALVNDLIDAVESVEARLDPAQDTTQAASSGKPGEPVAAGDELDDDAPGLMELDQLFADRAGDISHGFVELVEVMDVMKTVFTMAGHRMQSADPRMPGENEILRLAREAKPLTERFEGIGARMEQSATDADAALRQAWALADCPGTEPFRENLRQAVGQIEQMAEIETTIDEFLLLLRPMEVLSAGLRRSVTPLRRGAKQVRTAVSIVREWRNIGGNDSAAA